MQGIVFHWNSARFAPPNNLYAKLCGLAVDREYRLQDFDPLDTGTDVPDSFYLGNFAEVYQMIERSCDALLNDMERKFKLP